MCYEKSVYIREYFKSITRHVIMTNRKFWAKIKPFLTNKGMITSNEILLKQGDDIINAEGKVSEFLNNAYINVVEILPVRNHSVFLIRIMLLSQQQLNTILEKYKYHPSVLNIKKHSEQEECFSFSEVTTTDVSKIKHININKGMGEDQIPPKLSLLQTSSTPVLVQVLFLTWQKEPQLQLSGLILENKGMCVV